MKKAIVFFLLLWTTMPMQSVAQVNPQKGYIITNQNDTVHGTIDYLTDVQNVKACLFQKKGESEFRSLSPSDIKGYRLAGDGIYYVSRLFNDGERQELMFAEFLLQGGVSLYRYYYNDNNYFGFVNSDGKEVIIRDDKLNSDLTTYNYKLQDRRQTVQDINAVMHRDHTIASRLWKMDLTSSDLTEFVKQYDEQYCTDFGECIVFQYDKEKAVAVKHRFYVGAGIVYASYDSPSYEPVRYREKKYSEYSYSGIAPTFFVGTDIQFPRFSRSLHAQAELSYTPHRYKSSAVNTEGNHPEMVANEFAGFLGVNYVFCPDSRIKPFIKGSLILSWYTGMEEKNVDYRFRGLNDTYAGVQDFDRGQGLKGGVCFGAGVGISRFRVSTSWKRTLGNKGLNDKGCGILTVAYLF